MSDTATRLAAIARHILVTEGAGAVSMRRVAAAAGLTPMSIYRHFENRDALLKHVADECFAEIGRRWAQRPRSGELEQGIAELLDDHLDFAFGQPRLYDFVFTEPRDGARRWPDEFRDGGSPSLSLAADVLRGGITRGELRDDDEWELALMFAAMLHGLIQMYRGGRIGLPEDDLRSLCHRLVERMLNGFRV
ncbi:TetR/AcrR family transcriptional regulator [Actinoplanes sp. NEAU-A12]|uniref:TetR/AcrR family transcriptional regulator n=1 Tax=Actinoplanes sandaracinus TaxID=3045177 RepID=A0ABT6WT55_9ACTN|nr:TetR/AcrR family transcriptional regulator [Actinoplanes sandaracinus]MDI6102800.1 TetR/AcrR family transcriptional regulator [Actinoplanes sandaracinus]